MGIWGIYDLGMRKNTDVEVSPRIIPLVNACPKCGGALKASVLVGVGVLRPQKQLCVSYCGFERDLTNGK